MKFSLTKGWDLIFSSSLENILVLKIESLLYCCGTVFFFEGMCGGLSLCFPIVCWWHPINLSYVLYYVDSVDIEGSVVSHLSYSAWCPH